ncbi:Protein trichome birefringence-like 20, partial [Mucuna pruriens]
MRFRPIQLVNGNGNGNGKYTSGSTTKSLVILLPFTALLIFILSFSLTTNSSFPPPKIYPTTTLHFNVTEVKPCNIFSGDWIPYNEGPYYDNQTCNMIIDQQNCIKFGRPDRDFLKWRWKPDQCDLPLFDANLFLNLVKGKSMAFLGDSVGRNQMNSLLCLLNHVAHPEDITKNYTTDPIYFRRWFYADYNFTLVTLWSPFLVRAKDGDLKDDYNNKIMNLYLDKADEAWTREVESFHFVIISAGQWFFRPLALYEKGKLVGCNRCGHNNIKDLTHHYGYRKAFRTAFRTLARLKGYKGVTILRTFSPAHFENSEWNKGGSCERTKPYTKEEMKFDGFIFDTYLTQVKEFRAAQKKARKTGLKFLMLNTTEIMLRRPDGHPNNYVYGRTKNHNATYNDCVHWCLPGPVDTWNEFLFQGLILGWASWLETFRVNTKGIINVNPYPDQHPFSIFFLRVTSVCPVHTTKH